MIVIVGAGAMGGMLAVRLASIGQRVKLIEKSEALVTRLRAEGVILDGKNGIEKAAVPASTHPDESEPADMVFIYVKGQDTEEAVKSVKPIITEQTTVVTLQNGWGNADTLAKVVSPAQIVVGVSYDSVKTVDLGHVAHMIPGLTFIGPYREEDDLERADKVGKLLNEAGLETQVTAQVKTEIWKKLILNAAVLPTAGLTRVYTGNLSQQPLLQDVVEGLASEAIEVAQSLGYEIDRKERLDRIHALIFNGGKGKPSMLQDVEATRKTEIEYVNGAIVRAAQQMGVPVPLNRAILALVLGLESSWRQ